MNAGENACYGSICIVCKNLRYTTLVGFSSMNNIIMIIVQEYTPPNPWNMIIP